MEKAVAYIRASDQDFSPEAQLQIIRESLGPDVTLVASFTDRAVAAGQPPPGFQEVLDYLEHHQVDALVVQHLDRLLRTASELGTLLEHLKSRGVTLHTVADSPDIT
jgi:DNA invertase Pin-like site-specific DNA recombinase